MKITDIRLGYLSVPLKQPFKTALRTVNSVEDVIVKIETDTGHIGYGEAPPTGVITGDTTGAIIGAVEEHIRKRLIGLDLENFEEILLTLDKSLVHNTSTKAAVDIALYDLYGQMFNAPVYKLLGGYRKEIITDITISVDTPEKMAADSIDAVKLGYTTLKIKVGVDAEQDFRRMKAVREVVGYDVQLRIDANQGWKPKEAVRTLKAMEDSGLQVELVEQPVQAQDIEGLKFVTDQVSIPVMADESVFSPKDALMILHTRAADMINIKLMKCGGIHQALKICAMAEIYDVECMIGCMLEAKVSITAAVHLACAKKIITKIDLDGPVLCREDPVQGGAIFEHSRISLPDTAGLGFEHINGVVWKS
ncbi:mandelate racemase/muconate lactonizing protein [Candidatus Vecturithrix granuli]|uniref:Dipeptide epimerase n=1 Tax=Vecturithrix granuli TaxID=1499967 RepID=A0A081C487_VECG1|nr:mandelate racemase/muconate lactonizing protein [Candidatus Vecturithrix granuli]